MKKRFLAVLLALVLVVAMVPVTASAATTPQLKLDGTVTVPLSKSELEDSIHRSEVIEADGEDMNYYTGVFAFNPQEYGWYTFTSPQASQYTIYLIEHDDSASASMEEQLETSLVEMIRWNRFPVTAGGAHSYFGRIPYFYEDRYATSDGFYGVIVAYNGSAASAPKEVTLSVKKSSFPSISDGQSMSVELAQIAHANSDIYDVRAGTGSNLNDAYTYVTFTPNKTDSYGISLKAEHKDVENQTQWMFLVDVREITEKGETTIWSETGTRKVTATEFYAEYKLEKGKTYYIGVQNDQPATGTLTVKGLNPDPAPEFTDVAESAWYYTPVQWAVANGVTSGTSETTFSPGNKCTRAQAVTFLWNAKGQPEPESKENPFTDVKSTAWYYKAVLWAVENNITSGTSPTTFSPNSTCTRGQIVTFFHNYAGKPAASGKNPFTDVPEKQWYYQPILWAVSEGVTAGLTPTTFGPTNTCTRGQIVTFLYNYLGKK